MSDLLKEDRDQGLGAGLRIIADFAEHRQEDLETATVEVVQAILSAVVTDSKFNFYLLERIARMAVLGFETVSRPNDTPE